MGKKENAEIRKRLEKMNTRKWREIAERCPGRVLPEKHNQVFVCLLIQPRKCCLENCLPWHWRHS